MAKIDYQSLTKKAGRFLRNQDRLSLLLRALVLLLTAYLIFATKPWDPGLDFSESAKTSLRVHSYVMDGLWWGALINIFLLSICLFASRYYPRSNEGAANEITPELEAKTTSWKSLTNLQRRTILSLLFLAVALSAWLNAPLLNHSLWGDEEATARRFIVGYVSRQDDNSLKLHKPSWERTLWDFENGANNHIFFSVLGRLSHSFAKPKNGPDDYYFSEFWIRLPAYVAGLGAVATTAWLVVLLGFPRAAPLSAIILALHPWFVRWGTEARGYALQLFLIPLILVFFLKALRCKPHLRAYWWGAYGFTEFLLIYSHLGALHYLIPLNIAAFVLVWKHSIKSGLPANPFQQPLIWQLTAANIMGAILTIQLMAPCLKPMMVWLGKPRAKGDITPEWLTDWFSYYASGMPWNSWDDSNPYCLPLPQFLTAHPLLGYLLLLLVSTGIIAGIIAFMSNRQRCWLLLPLITPGLLTVMHAKMGGNLLYPWYMVSFLPLSIGLFSIGIDHISRLIPQRASFAVISVFFIVIFGLTTQSQRQLFRTHPVEALAESVRLTRTVINPFHPDVDDVITLDIVHATRLYDPAHLKIRTLDSLVDALKLADTSNRPLYLNLGNPGLLGRDLPRIGLLIKNRKIFEKPILIHGLQNPCTRYIFRYHPGSIDSISLTDLPQSSFAPQ